MWREELPLMVLFRQTLPFLDFTGMKFHPRDSFDLVHCCSHEKSRLNNVKLPGVRQGSNTDA